MAGLRGWEKIEICYTLSDKHYFYNPLIKCLGFSMKFFYHFLLLNFTILQLYLHSSELQTDASTPIPVILKCEYLSAPLGIDAPHPRLSWQMSDDRHGASQTAYQIYVGISFEAINQISSNNKKDSTNLSEGVILFFYQLINKKNCYRPYASCVLH